MDTVEVKIGFFLVGGALSVFFGAYAPRIFKLKTEEWHFSHWVHQFLLNFVGSAVGWVAAWFVLRRVVECFQSSCAPEFTLSDIGLAFVAFVGVTGFLPMATVNLFGNLSSLAENVAKKWK